MLHAGCLWHFLSLPRSALEDNVFAVLGKVEEKIRSSNWKLWLSRVGEERKAALFMRSFAHTVTARPIARSAEIPGTGITWGDAENDASSCSQGLRRIHIHMQGNSFTGVSWSSHSHVQACCLSCKSIELHLGPMPSG